MSNIQLNGERRDEYIFKVRCRERGDNGIDLLRKLLPLTERFPKKFSDIDNIKRIAHCFNHGYIVTAEWNGKVVGYSETYKVRRIPDPPVLPLPVNDPAGDHLFVWVTVADGIPMLRGMKRKAAEELGINYFCYHKFKRNYRPYTERIKRYEPV